MINLRWLATRLLLLCVPVPLVAQHVDVRARLETRGVPARLARSVAGIADRASSRGVPAGPLADKALEGWAKHVPEQRILSAVQSFADRMAVAVRAVRDGTSEMPPGDVVAAAAEAMGGGLGVDECDASCAPRPRRRWPDPA